MYPSKKMRLDIPPFLVMEVLEKAQELERKGHSVIHLEVGEPDFETPECIKEAAIKALKDGHTGYTHSLGLLELREAICKYYHSRYCVLISPEQIVITSGSSPAMFLAFASFLEHNDSVLMTDPCYACYPNFIKFLGCNPVCIPVYEESGFQLLREDIDKELIESARLMIINSPANPTGMMLDKIIMEDMASKGIFIASDEIYHGLEYNEPAHSILEFTKDAFVFNGFSKLFAMTGWRLGYLVAPKKYIRTIQKLQQNFFISANSISQHAGIAALEHAWDDVESMKKAYNKRRKYIIKRLRELGFGILKDPDSAFYVLANAKKFTNDSLAFAFNILENAHVAVTPGIDFGNNSEGYIRFSYASKFENIEEGMARLESYIEKVL